MARVKKAEDEVTPKRIRLTAPHAYYTDGNELRAWADGQVVDGDEAAHLIERGAHHEEIT